VYFGLEKVEFVSGPFMNHWTWQSQCQGLCCKSTSVRSDHGRRCSERDVRLFDWRSNCKKILPNY